MNISPTCRPVKALFWATVAECPKLADCVDKVVPGRAVRNAPAVLTEREDRTVGSDDGVFREAKAKEFSEKVFHVV
jgi:hypothetical protein